jgi:hypothetical protein
VIKLASRTLKCFGCCRAVSTTVLVLCSHQPLKMDRYVLKKQTDPGRNHPRFARLLGPAAGSFTRRSPPPQIDGALRLPWAETDFRGRPPLHSDHGTRSAPICAVEQVPVPFVSTALVTDIRIGQSLMCLPSAPGELAIADGAGIVLSR